MKFCVLFCSVICGLPLIASATPNEQGQQAITSQLQPLASKALVLDIKNAGNTLVAVGERGHILRLAATGNWQQVLTPSRNLLTRVTFVDAVNGWAVGHDATVMHSDDAGATWQLQYRSEELARPLMDVYFHDAQQGLAVGAYGLFLRTQDGGKHWQREFHDELLNAGDAQYLQQLKTDDPQAYQQESDSILPHFNRLLPLSDGRLLLVGEMGLVAVSNDMGVHWQRLMFPYEGSLFAAKEYNGKVYVGGLRGNLFASDLSLQSWQSITLPQKTTINGITQVAGQLWLVGNSGVIIRLDADNQAQLVRQLKGENLLALAVAPKGGLWLAGTKGLQPITLE